LLTRSGLTYPEVSSKIRHDSFYQLGNSVSLPWVIYYEAFYLHVVSSFSCIPVISPKLLLFLIPLPFVYLFRNLPKCSVLLRKACRRFGTTYRSHLQRSRNPRKGLLEFLDPTSPRMPASHSNRVSYVDDI